MIPKRLFIFSTIVVILITNACSYHTPALREVELKPGMQEVANKYKELLEPEIFQLGPGLYHFDTVTTHKVIVTLLNPKNLPGTENKIEDLAISMAGDIYPQLINKSDYSKIVIVFQNQSGTVISINRKRNYSFSYSEIEKHIEDRLMNNIEL